MIDIHGSLEMNLRRKEDEKNAVLGKIEIEELGA